MRGKYELGLDRLLTYVDVRDRKPTSRMLEAAFAHIADSINYTVEGVLIVMGRSSSQYRGAPAALSAAYPVVSAASKKVPPEAVLRSIIARVPSEAELREVIERRNTSVHNYPNVTYVSAQEVQEAFAAARSFWGGAVSVLTAHPDFRQVGDEMQTTASSAGVASA